MKTVNIPAKACPVVDEVDVLVVGGGAAGIGAAIGAAQCGASVALVEYFGALGGLLGKAVLKKHFAKSGMI